MAACFRDFKFGYASAELEGANEPDLLLEGFFNQKGVIDEVRNSHKFLFLGYKGSGKSAISQHMRLLSERESQLFVTASYLADFPYTDFKNIIRGDAEAQSRYPSAWSWLLLISMMSSFHRDEGASANSDPDFLESVRTLKELGLLPSPSLRQVVLVSSKRSFKIALPKLLEGNFERSAQEQGLQIPFFVERLKSVCQKFRGESKHILIIDGLDDILTSRNIQYEALAALVIEVSRLNLMFQQCGTPAKIVLLCRTDLYERLPGANKNKIRQDSAVNLDWYHDPRNPGGSNLIRLANLRARLTRQGIRDVFSLYFPSQVEHRNMLSFLLDLTRHTPRDFLQLLKNIQHFSRAGRLTRDEILSGVRSYSIEYFLPEIKDELVGYVARDDTDTVMELLGSLRKRDFSFGELEEKARGQSRFGNLDLPSIITALFECSAVGNVFNRPGGATFYTFKFRNRNSSLNLGERLILHRGMWKALNLI
jgi:hypothetical protein